MTTIKDTYTEVRPDFYSDMERLAEALTGYADCGIIEIDEDGFVARPID